MPRGLLNRAFKRPSTSHDVCHDLAAWAAAHEPATRLVLDAAFTTTRPLPATLGPVEESFEPLCRVDVPERALVKLPGARVRGEVGLVILPDGTFVGELVAVTPQGQRSMLAALPAFSDPLPARPTRLRGNYYAALGFGSGHYYHWSHDIVMSARGVARHLPADTKVLVPPVMAPYQHETLALLGLDDRERVPFAGTECWELENLFVITPKLKTQLDSAEPFEWFRRGVFERYDVGERLPSRRVFLSRRFDSHWRATNEAEVEAVLAPLGFETVAPATLTFQEQVELFSRAETIVGTGAGLFNMVFAPRTVKVLQLQEPRHVVHALWTQAAAMGFDYWYLMCETVPNADHADADLRVPLDALRATLQAMGVV